MRFGIDELLRPGCSLLPRSAAGRYGFAVFVAVLMVVTRYALDPILGDQAPFLSSTVAVIFAALIGGWLPGLVATALSTIGVAWLCEEPHFSFALADPNAIAGLALFVVVGSLISVLVGQLRTALMTIAEAEDKLRRQNQLVDLSHDAIVALDSAWQIVRWNAGAEEIYGWSSADAVGKPVSAILQTRSAVSVTEIREILSLHGRWEGELEQVARDGRPIWVESRQVLLRDGRNNPAGILEVNRDITRRKQAEEVLRRANEQRDVALESANMGTWTLDVSSGEVTTDERARALFGFEDDVSVTYARGLERLHPEDRQRVGEAVEEALDPASSGEHYAEFRVPFLDGTVRWVAAKGQARFEGDDGDRRAVRLAGTVQDITARKQADERLRESESFYRQTLESIPGMVFTIRPDGFCDYQSQQWVDYTGIPMGEHLGEGWNKLLHPDDRQRALAAWVDAVQGGAPYDLNYRVRRRDGTYEWFKVIARPIRDAAGRIVRWFGVALNIEDLKRAEEASREALEWRKLAMETANLGAWEYEFETGRISCDQRCQAVFALPGDHGVQMQEAMARIHPEDRMAVQDALKDALAGVHGGGYYREFRVVWPDGSIHWLAGHGQVFFEGEGEQRRPVRFVGVGIDMTERRSAEERLRQTQKLESVGLLAGGIAHDFNNLLTGIMGNASLLLEETGPGPAKRIEEIIQGAERAAHLTRQLLAYSGKGQFVTRDIDVSEAVQGIGDLVRFSIPKNVDLAISLQRRLPPVRMDPSQLEQVVMNLVINAGEAVGEGKPGKVSVATLMVDIARPFVDALGQEVAPGRYVVVEVGDTGAGMNEEKQARIFDPFFTTKFMGRGLGLAAVAGILRSQKGAITVESIPDTGSTFRVLLPTAGPHRQDAGERRPADARATVLVVDDEKPVREFIAAVLRKEGYRVLTGCDGREGLSVFEREDGNVDILVLDVVMPVMGACQMLPAVKERRPNVKVLLTSGYSEPEARRLCSAYGNAAFIQKPYTAQQLARAVEELLVPVRRP